MSYIILDIKKVSDIILNIIKMDSENEQLLTDLQRLETSIMSRGIENNKIKMYKAELEYLKSKYDILIN